MPELDLPEPPWIVGHRGVGGDVPENTVESVLEAAAQKADMVELDLQLTGDSELVVYHDLAVRLSDERSKPVTRLTREERRRARLIWKPRGVAVEYRIPTLAEVLEAAPAELPLNLEIKRWDRRIDPGEMLDQLGEAIAGRVGILVSSFDWTILPEVREKIPGLPLAPLGGRGAEWDEIVELARRLDAFSIHLNRHLATALGRRGTL
ncbi:MAG: glycerophosphodiester phosphodiesterase, partial [Thermoanaerobaculia bacterium]